MTAPADPVSAMAPPIHSSRRRVFHQVLVAVGWIVTAALLVQTLIAVEFSVNFFSWSGGWDASTAGELAVLAAGEAGCVILAASTRAKPVRVLSWFVVATLLVFGVLGLRPEPLEAGWLGRSQVSPWWYRGARFVACTLPLASAVLVPLTRRTAPKSSAAAGPSQTV